MIEAEEEIKGVLETLKKYDSVMSVILFGSYAKNKAKPLSDIDIAVMLKDESTEAEISSFSSNVMDVSPFHRLPLYIQFEVLKYGKVLFSRDENYFMDVKKKVLGRYLEMSSLYERMSRRMLA